MVLCHGQHIITVEFDFISLIIYDFDRSKRIRKFFHLLMAKIWAAKLSKVDPRINKL